MESQVKVWEKIAPSWNKYRTEISSSVKEFLSEIKGKLLDVGCGSGRNFIKNDNQELYAIDFSSEMIKLAKKNAKEKGINAKLNVMDIDKLEFKDEFFDGVLCYAVLHCIKGKEKRKKVLKEIYRVLKKDRIAFISVWSKNSKRLKNKKKEDFINWTIKENDKVKRYNYIYDSDELKKELQEIGFKILKEWEERNINFIVSKSF